MHDGVEEAVAVVVDTRRLSLLSFKALMTQPGRRSVPRLHTGSARAARTEVRVGRGRTPRAVAAARMRAPIPRLVCSKTATPRDIGGCCCWRLQRALGTAAPRTNTMPSGASPARATLKCPWAPLNYPSRRTPARRRIPPHLSELAAHPHIFQKAALEDAIRMVARDQFPARLRSHRERNACPLNQLWMGWRASYI